MKTFNSICKRGCVWVWGACHVVFMASVHPLRTSDLHNYVLDSCTTLTIARWKIMQIYLTTIWWTITKAMWREREQPCECFVWHFSFIVMIALWIFGKHLRRYLVRLRMGQSHSWHNILAYTCETNNCFGYFVYRQSDTTRSESWQSISKRERIWWATTRGKGSPYHETWTGHLGPTQVFWFSPSMLHW